MRNSLIKNAVICLVLLIVGIILIYKSFSPSKTTSDYLYSYKIDKSSDYTVEIGNNNFYSTDTLEDNGLYISDLVKNININYKANYSINTNSNIYYNYKIINTLYVKYSGAVNSDGNLWEKEIVLENSELETLKNQNGFNIDNNITLNYQEYRLLVRNFKETYNLPVEAYMEVKVIIDYDLEITKTNEKRQQQAVISLKIPLLQEVFAIEENYQKSENQNFVKEQNVDAKVNKPLIIVGTVIIGVSILIILYAIKKEMKLNIKNDYTVALNRILKSYGDIVAEVVSPVETDYMKIVEVKNFDQLLDIEEEIRMPILFYETIPGQEGEFVILYDNMVYRYIISGKK